MGESESPEEAVCPPPRWLHPELPLALGGAAWCALVSLHGARSAHHRCRVPVCKIYSAWAVGPRFRQVGWGQLLVLEWCLFINEHSLAVGGGGTCRPPALLACVMRGRGR